MSVPFCGAGFVIPDLNVQKSFYLGKRFSIFTSELYAILMALNYICSIYFLDLCWLKMRENALKNWDCKMRSKVFNTLYHVLSFVG